jgi:hypothetical protein
VRWLRWADRIDLLDRPGRETPYLTDSFAVGTQLRYPSSVAPWIDKVSRGEGADRQKRSCDEKQTADASEQ